MLTLVGIITAAKFWLHSAVTDVPTRSELAQVTHVMSDGGQQRSPSRFLQDIPKGKPQLLRLAFETNTFEKHVLILEWGRGAGGLNEAFVQTAHRNRSFTSELSNRARSAR